MRKLAGVGVLDTREFKEALGEVLQRACPGWQNDTKIDELSVWTLFIELKLALGRRGQSEEPTSQDPLVRDMTAQEFVVNMYQAYGITP